MFNRTIVEPAQVRVNVEQQPADAADAARFYGECVARAEAAVANATLERFGAHNEIKVVKVTSLRNVATDRTTGRLIFTINGEVYDITLDVDQDDMRHAAYVAVAQNLLRQVLDQLIHRSPRLTP